MASNAAGAQEYNDDNGVALVGDLLAKVGGIIGAVGMRSLNGRRSREKRRGCGARVRRDELRCSGRRANGPEFA